MGLSIGCVISIIGKIARNFVYPGDYIVGEQDQIWPGALCVCRQREIFATIWSQWAAAAAVTVILSKF